MSWLCADTFLLLGSMQHLFLHISVQAFPVLTSATYVDVGIPCSTSFFFHWLAYLGKFVDLDYQQLFLLLGSMQHFFVRSVQVFLVWS